MLNQLADTLSKINDRTPTFEAERCLNQCHAHAGQCAACAAACPMDAITLTPVPQIEPSECLACGACVAACPGEALGGQRAVTDIWLDACQAADGAGSIAFVCRAVGGEQLAATRIPCRSALPLELYVALAAAGIRVATIYTADCAECPLANCIPQAEQTIADANVLLNAVGLSVEVRQHGGRPARTEAKQNGVSRRDFLAAFFKRPEKPVSDNHDLDRFMAAGNGPRRALLRDALSRVPLADTARLPGYANHWGMLAASEACVGCPMCSQLCPTGALDRIEAADHGVQLGFDPARCVACGLCIRACFKHALSWQPDLPLAALATDDYLLIWEGYSSPNPLKA